MAARFLTIACIVANAAVADARPTMADYKAAKAKERFAADAAAAKEAKMGAVNKVVSMLQSLQQKVTEEGEKEQKHYDKIARECGTEKVETGEDISEEHDDVDTLDASIEKLVEEKGGLLEAIEHLTAEIGQAGEDIKSAKSENEKARKQYRINQADMKSAVESLHQAIKVMKNSKSSLVQLQSVGKTVQHAILMADALGLGKEAVKKATSALLQQEPDVDMETYKFQGGEIISTLEDLFEDFKKQSHEVDEEELKRKQAYELFVQTKTDSVNLWGKQIETVKKVASAEASEEIASAEEELSSVSGMLKSDTEHLDEVSSQCDAKAKEWKQRSATRESELAAIDQAIKIVTETVADKISANTARLAQTGVTVRLADAIATSDSAMEAIEAEAEAEDQGAVGFLQKKSINIKGKKHHHNKQVNKHHEKKAKKQAGTKDDEARQVLLTFFTERGQELKSAALAAVASKIAADPFAKIKGLLQDMVEKLLEEQASEANHKGLCDKQLAEAEQKRDTSSDGLASANSKMAKLEARKAKLGEQLDRLKKEADELSHNMAEAEEERDEEKAENEDTVKEAQEGVDAIKMAMDLLNKFYKTAANEAKSSGVEDAYSGGQDQASGIIAMMEVIESDFYRTVKQTAEDEKSAVQMYKKLMTSMHSTLAENDVATRQTNKLKDDAEVKYEEEQETMEFQSEELKTALAELMAHKSSCVDNGGSYEDRVRQREEEIQSLKKGFCIISAMNEAGPDGAADEC